MTGERKTEAVRQNYDNSGLLPTYGAQFLAHTPSHIFLLSVTIRPVKLRRLSGSGFGVEVC